MRKINTFIFDGSGVLFDDLPTVVRANMDAYSFYGYKAFTTIEEFRKKFKLPIKEFHRSNGIPEEMIDKVEKKYRERYPLHQHLTTPFPEVKGALSKLKNKNIKLGVSSNIPNKFLKEHLSQSEIMTYFDAITGQDDCEEQKPSPKPILITLSKLNASPINAAYVGDMEEDMIAGRRAGVYTIAVDRKEAYQPIWRLKPYADYVITNLNDILKII
jgi:HAD superfamily hydrolase (TIGR01549 family)